MRKLFREILSWGLAILLAAGILNLFAFCYYHPVHKFPRAGGATYSLAVPHQWGLYGMEGYGIQKIDRNGYVNPDLPRAPGASYFYIYTLFFLIALIAVEGYALAKTNGFMPLHPLNLKTFGGKLVFVLLVLLTVMLAYFGDSAFI